MRPNTHATVRLRAEPSEGKAGPHLQIQPPRTETIPGSPKRQKVNSLQVTRVVHGHPCGPQSLSVSPAGAARALLLLPRSCACTLRGDGLPTSSSVAVVLGRKGHLQTLHHFIYRASRAMRLLGNGEALSSQAPSTTLPGSHLRSSNSSEGQVNTWKSLGSCQREPDLPGGMLRLVQQQHSARHSADLRPRAQSSPPLRDFGPTPAVLPLL